MLRMLRVAVKWRNNDVTDVAFAIRHRKLLQVSMSPLLQRTTLVGLLIIKQRNSFT